MQRSKTDLTAAAALREYAVRMPFVRWVPPAAPVVHLRAIARRIAALVVECTRERNRLHALTASAAHLAVVANHIAVNIRHLERRTELLTAQAIALIAAHADLQRAFDRVTSIPGIASIAPCSSCPSCSCCPTT